MLIGKRVKISEEQNKKLELIAIIFFFELSWDKSISTNLSIPWKRYPKELRILFLKSKLATYILTHFVFKKDTRNISIFVDGTRITQVGGRRIDLNTPGNYTIGDPNGDFNIIEIKDHKYVHLVYYNFL